MNRKTHSLRTLVIALALAAAAPLAVAGHHEGDHAKPMQAKGDIVDTAVAAGKFNTLAAALTAAGLVDTLKGNGPFTVFAPTDEAFAALPAGTVEDLLKPENKDKLLAILTYHVVPGRFPSGRVAVDGHPAMRAAVHVDGRDAAVRRLHERQPHRPRRFAVDE